VGHHIIVCPADATLLNRLAGRAVVLRIASLDAFDRAVDGARTAGALLHCVAVESRHPLGLLTLEERWKDVPIALAVPSLGRLRDVVRLLPLIRQMNVRISLPADSAENLRGLRILSSWGVACTATPGSGPIPWDRFSDLGTYALFGLVPHGPIEPFDYLATHYVVDARTDFRGVWFEDPTRFVHMDGSGRFAFSSTALAAGDFAGLTPDELDGIDESDAYREHLESWRRAFLEKDGCASCPGWRICLGAFQDKARTDPRCRDAFSDLLDEIERHQASARKERRELWQA
jgi:hypothetical protein